MGSLNAKVHWNPRPSGRGGCQRDSQVLHPGGPNGIMARPSQPEINQTPEDQPRDTPDAGAAEIAAAAAAWDKARRDDQTRDGRTKGNEVAVRAAERRREAALAIARPLWGLPSEDMPATEIAKRAGLSVGTLYRFLDRRSLAQRRAKANPVQTDLEDFTGPSKAAKRKGKTNA